VRARRSWRSAPSAGRGGERYRGDQEGHDAAEPPRCPSHQEYLVSGQHNFPKDEPASCAKAIACDNALCESFFATLECERLERRRFATRAEAQLAVFDYLEGWYNPRRRHSALDYLSPMAYEKRELVPA
jgi:hypothetical protein